MKALLAVAVLLVVQAAVVMATNETHTVLQWRRKLVTCDQDGDMQLSMAGTTQMIYAYDSRVPETPSRPTTKHQHRGTKSVNLLGNPDDPVPLEPDAFTIDLNMTNYQDPGKYDTVYYCKPFKLDIQRKLHVVRYNSVVAAGSELHVHHMVLYVCPKLTDQDLAWEGDCERSPDMSSALRNCMASRILAVWAVGGEVFILPKDTGYVVSPDQGQYLLLQMHYDNPNTERFADNSGMRLWLTPTLRPQDAGIFFVGPALDPRTFFIPPGQTDYIISGDCPRECTKKVAQPLTVFGSFLHAHLAGRRLYLKHIRNGVELPEIGREQFYDFNFQITRIVKPEITVLPGDSFRMFCHYDTSTRQNVTIAGESTHQEMCFGFISYYPLDPNFDRCFSDTYNGQHLAICTPEQREPIVYQPENITVPYVPPNPCPSGHTDPEPPAPYLADSFDPTAYMFSEFLDPARNYKLYWNFDDSAKALDLAVEVNTTGWVGLGFSPDGNMIGSDVTIGWVDKDKVYMSDRFVPGPDYGIPKVDKYQDNFNMRGLHVSVSSADRLEEPPTAAIRDADTKPYKSAHGMRHRAHP